MMLEFNLIIAFIVLALSTIVDIKKREVPDYLSYGLIITSSLTTIIYAIVYSNYLVLIYSILGYAIGWTLGNMMFYLGQWGGGDTKLMMGLGIVFGFNAFTAFGEKNYYLLIFILNVVFCGAIYGSLWSIFLAIKNKKIFIKQLKEWTRQKHVLLIRKILIFVIIFLILLTVFVVPQEYKLILLGFIALFYVMFYLWIFVKIIEENCMTKFVKVSQLTEGDWIPEDIYVGKKFIVGPKDLGISNEQISILKKYETRGKIKLVKIKEGIPFVPALLLAYIATILIWYLGIF